MSFSPEVIIREIPLFRWGSKIIVVAEEKVEMDRLIALKDVSNSARGFLPRGEAALQCLHDSLLTRPDKPTFSCVAGEHTRIPRAGRPLNSV